MKINQALVASLTAIAYSFVFVGCASVDGTDANGGKRTVTVAEVVATLGEKKTSELSLSEATDLSLAKLVKGDIAGARACARVGAQKAKTPTQKAAFYALMAKTYGMEGNYREAANTALEGQQIDPNSVELAACRFEYFSQLPGEAAQMRSAEDQLRSLDPNYKRQAVVFDAATGIAALIALKVLVDRVVIPRLKKSESERAKWWLEIAQTTSDVLESVGLPHRIALGPRAMYP